MPDELYLDFFQRGRFDVALGPMKTRAVTRGGVVISSLDRLNSPNVAVNWTDRAALRYITDSGWNSKVILQYNDNGGSSALAGKSCGTLDDGIRRIGLRTQNPIRDGCIDQHRRRHRRHSLAPGSQLDGYSARA